MEKFDRNKCTVIDSNDSSGTVRTAVRLERRRRRRQRDRLSSHAGLDVGVDGGTDFSTRTKILKNVMNGKRSERIVPKNRESVVQSYMLSYNVSVVAALLELGGVVLREVCPLLFSSLLRPLFFSRTRRRRNVMP